MIGRPLRYYQANMSGDGDPIYDSVSSLTDGPALIASVATKADAAATTAALGTKADAATTTAALAGKADAAATTAALATKATTAALTTHVADNNAHGIPAVVASVATKADANNAVLTGTPTAPTPSTADSSTKLATTAFVAAVFQQILGAATPAQLDTINELAAALGNDANFAATVTAALTTKAARAANLSDLSDVNAARSNLNVFSQTEITTTYLAKNGNGSQLTGLTKAQVGLPNVANVDTTNAANVTTGVFNVARIPALPYLPRAGGTMLGNIDFNNYSITAISSIEGFEGRVIEFNPYGINLVGGNIAEVGQIVMVDGGFLLSPNESNGITGLMVDASSTGDEVIVATVAGTDVIRVNFDGVSIYRALNLSNQALYVGGADVQGFTASMVSGGVFAPARLGTGTANNSTVLRGDGTFSNTVNGTFAATHFRTAQGIHVGLDTTNIFNGIWFGVAAGSQTISNYAFLADPGSSGTILNAIPAGYFQIRIGNDAFNGLTFSASKNLVVGGAYNEAGNAKLDVRGTFTATGASSIGGNLSVTGYVACYSGSYYQTGGTADSLTIDCRAGGVSGIQAKNLGTTYGFWAVAGGLGYFFNDAGLGDLIFRSESNRILFGVGTGNSVLAINAGSTGLNGVANMYNVTAPTTNLSGGGRLYVESGALKYRGSSGTVTVLGNA